MFGVTMSEASEVMAKPTTSARIAAPRARACSSSSKTKTAAPSPCTMPLRFLENGRQPSFDMTRRPSQALMPPKQSMLSLPPVSTTSARPARISPIACPMAWFEEAQAVATV